MLTANWDLNDRFTLSPITAYRKRRSDLFMHIDATEAGSGDVFVKLDQYHFNQELQLKWNTGKEFSSVGNSQTVWYGDPRAWNATVGFVSE